MPTKISQLTSAIDITANDLIQILDVEDGVMAPSGTNKKATASLLANQLVPLINAGAIAGSKVSPNFGAQNIVTTGTLTAGIGSVISGSGAGNALRITQTGTGNALVVEDSVNPDLTPFVIDASSRIICGADTTPTGFAAADVNVVGRDTFKNVSISRVTDSTTAPQVYFQKSRGTFASPEIVSSGDFTGQINFYGFDGANSITNAGINAEIDGVPNIDSMPGRLVFKTTQSGNAFPSEALRITSGQGIKIARVSVTTPVESDGNVFSGTYTPTLTNVTNLDSSTAFSCQYMRVGNVVTVSGRVEMDPIATVNTELRMSIPIDSDFSLTTHCGGAFSSFNSNNGSIRADSVTNDVFFGFLSNTTSNTSFHFTFTYRVV